MKTIDVQQRNDLQVETYEKQQLEQEFEEKRKSPSAENLSDHKNSTFNSQYISMKIEDNQKFRE